MCRLVSERAFEDAIEAALLRGGPDEVVAGGAEVRERPEPFGYDGMQPGGYHRRRSGDYDRGDPITGVRWSCACWPAERSWWTSAPRPTASPSPTFVRHPRLRRAARREIKRLTKAYAAELFC